MIHNFSEEISIVIKGIQNTALLVRNEYISPNVLFWHRNLHKQTIRSYSYLYPHPLFTERRQASVDAST